MRYLFFLILWPVAALAQPAFDEGERMLEDVSELILSYGNGALTADDVGIAMSHATAQARLRAMTDVLSADLDADGAVTEAEFLAIQGALTPWETGRLAARLLRGDTDGDGTLSAAEVSAFVEARIAQRLSEPKLMLWADAMRFDTDNDGTLTLREADRAIRAAQAAESAT
ncbi:MAG: hypothetical protein ACU0DW_05055 [Shimia sp.]